MTRHPIEKPPHSDSIRPIRALLRGLDCLRALNGRNGATVTEIAQETGLPRTTAYRVLETLCLGGYVVRDPSDERYRPTIAVRALSDGFEDEPWIREIAKPLIEELCREIVWPIAIATLSGTSMLVRETTDRNSPLALARYSAGTRVPLLGSAAGRVYLAFCPAEQRATLLKILAHAKGVGAALAREPDVQQMLDEVARRGYVFYTWEKHRETAVSVPIHSDGRLLGTLALRYMTSALTRQQVVQDYVPQLKLTADKIGRTFAERIISGYTL